MASNSKQLKGRKTTVFKKAAELSTLCGVDVLLVMYDPDTPNTPQTWCSKPDTAAVINEYLRKTKNVKEEEEKVYCGKKDGGGLEFIQKLSLDELKNLSAVLAGKIEDVKQRIDIMKVGPWCVDGVNFGELGNFEMKKSYGEIFTGFESDYNNQVCTSSEDYSEDHSELMIDFSDFDDIKFDNDHDHDHSLDLIKKLASGF